MLLVVPLVVDGGAGDALAGVGDGTGGQGGSSNSAGVEVLHNHVLIAFHNFNTLSYNRFLVKYIICQI